MSAPPVTRRRRTRRPVAAAWAVGALCCALALSGCSQDGGATPGPSPSAGRDASGAPRPSPPVPSPVDDAGPDLPDVDRTDPEQVAAAFVHGFVHRAPDDPTVREYLRLVEPFTTERLLTELRESTEEWCDRSCREERERGVRVSADAITPAISEAAPRTEDEVWVQVGYEMAWSWPGGGDSMPAGVSLKLVRTDGTWRVDRRTTAG
ncbi:hypothetical protein [Streptomyces chumphonensis]|uniref:hypothetical protein n=1 Tax=Streptomyces chumphonensis TaxID=1214925 RepID=UPI003D735634